MTRVRGIPDQNMFFAYFNTIHQLLEEIEDESKQFMYDHLVYSRCVSRSHFTILFYEWLSRYKRFLGLEQIEGIGDINEVYKVIDNDAVLKSMHRKWDDTPLSSLTLTSVGIVIAITYLRSIKIGISYEDWIN